MAEVPTSLPSWLISMGPLPLTYSLSRESHLNPDRLINWGQPLDKNGDRVAVIEPIKLSSARLTDADISLITSLRLSDKRSEADRSVFASLMQELPVHYDSSGLDSEWIMELFAFIPKYEHVFKEGDNTGIEGAVEYYVKQHVAAPMLALYILMLRSNFWRKQIGTITTMGFAQGLPSESVYTFEELAGDPTSLTDLGNPSIYELFDDREDLLCLFTHFPEGDPKMTGLYDLMRCMEIVVAVAAAAHDGLQRFVDAFASWRYSV